MVMREKGGGEEEEAEGAIPRIEWFKVNSGRLRRGNQAGLTHIIGGLATLNYRPGLIDSKLQSCKQ